MSQGGKRYFLTFFVHLKYMVVYPLRLKDEVFEKFKEIS